MKTLDAAKTRNMAEVLASKIMLAVMASLCIRFICAYLIASVWFQIIPVASILTFTCARKRIINRNIHDRKFALFTKNPNSRAGLFGTCNFYIKDVKSLVRSAKRQNAI